MESKNNYVVRRYGFHWRYDTTIELDLLNQLWNLVSLKLNFFTPTKKPVDYTTTTDGRRRRRYDQPRTPWQRVCAANILTDEQTTATQARINGINPADLTRQITQIQTRLIELAAAKTQALLTGQHLDIDSLQPSINRLTATTRKPTRAQRA